ncbi:MAG: Rieske 2Fe-2S domain-containing protein [Deltaproteobacteria bacterium]|nr:Rieske 2Fe-2S domain-containing protein [Deltaproteobacteria bacterium]MBI3387873.1 Rieske 2Fe-2S domain-containing protein [Deltaproteobacteria bacterium]
MGEFIRVAAPADIPAGQGRTFEVNGKKVAVFNCDGEFYAIDDTCKHRGGPLGDGDLDGCIVACPWHGWTYDVTTGVSPDDPDAAVDRYEVKVDADGVHVAV